MTCNSNSSINLPYFRNHPLAGTRFLLSPYLYWIITDLCAHREKASCQARETLIQTKTSRRSRYPPTKCCNSGGKSMSSSWESYHDRRDAGRNGWMDDDEWPFIKMVAHETKAAVTHLPRSHMSLAPCSPSATLVSLSVCFTHSITLP